jgi:DUF1680 family protein
MNSQLLIFLATLIGVSPTYSATTHTTPVSDKVVCAVPDKQDFQIPDRVHLTGWLGTRITANEVNRLADINTAGLLDGFRNRPGKQAWDGEHVGKWLHAATLAWVYTGNPALRQKLDYVAAELIKCQLPDGYLGTYMEKNHWTEWDVWVHKYNLVGLLTYMRYTGNMEPLPACQRMGNLLCNTFGDAPGRRDIIRAGYHAGMAPTSVLEPMVLLYRFTGDPCYLDFCNYIVRAWEQPNGPHIVSRLLEQKGVNKVGNAKAYEMLSCLNGALELYRTTGDRKLLDACRNAWQDIVDNRLYITGSASSKERFLNDGVLPNDMASNICETCVTVTWMQVNLQLLRLTGESKFGDQLEKTVYNQLMAAQKPRGDDWCYYTPLEGRKPYDKSTTCCHSSGPRGIALLPTFAITTDQEGAVINLFDAGTAQVALRDGTPVTFKIETLYPSDGKILITVETAATKEFSIKLRVPAWCKENSISPAGAKIGSDGYAVLHREWKSGDTIELNLKLEPCVVVGDHTNQGKVAIVYGPLVLAADGSLLTGDIHDINTVAMTGTDLKTLDIRAEPAPAEMKTWAGSQVFRINVVARSADNSTPSNTPSRIGLVPFADAGVTRKPYRVWLPLAGQPNANVLLGGVESRSRQGNQTGSINDDDPYSFATTYDGQSAKEDWFAVTLAQPVTASRVVFIHGKIFHDGGWFDASAGKPRVQIQHTAGGPWETIGELGDYPATTATDSKELLWYNDQFTLKLATPATFVAVRVIGVPASGDNPKRAFASCAELQSFSEGSSLTHLLHADSNSPVSAQRTVEPVVPPKAAPFFPADVCLLDGPFKLSRDAEANYLLSLDVDRLLAPYRIEAGLKPKAPQYPGWETNTLPGVALGFYLSGISCLANGAGNQEFTRRLDYILDELEICQKATGGYLLGTRNGRAIFARVEKEGKFEGFAPWEQGAAEPYYALEKIFSGLRDAYRIGGRPKALHIETRLGDWLDGHMSHLSDSQMANLMTVEFGGMNWVLSDLYADTGDARYLALSRRWQDKTVFDGPAAGKDDLAGKHANTQFPKFSGLAARYPFSGDPADLKTAVFFWESVVRHHSYVTGGNSIAEHFGPPDKLNNRLSQFTAENCNEYNMLRLTQLLFNIQPKPEYAEYLERTLFNHILSAQDVRNGRICYFLPLKPGASRAPEGLFDVFSCCVCSGFDSYSKNSGYIYSHSADGLYVNLFVASEVNWKEKGLVLRQETKFPDEDTATFHFNLREPARFSFYLRYPAWAAEGITVQVNGAAQNLAAAPGEFFALDREWRDGDTVVFKAPLALRYETMPDNQDRVALFAGPILLAGNLGPVADPAADEPDYLPLLVPEGKPVGQWLQATGTPLTFKTTVARPREIVVQPFFRLQGCSYAVYWDRVTPAGWETHVKDCNELRAKVQQLEARTVDKTLADDLASETSHQLEGENNSSTGRGNRGLAMHLTWRQVKAGQSISYRMKVSRDKPVAIRCRYLVEIYPKNEFDIQVDGTTIAHEKTRDFIGEAAVEYPVPPEITKGKDEIRVVIRATAGKTSNKLAELRVLKN